MLSRLSPHVLVAEDDPHAALALREFLSWSGCRVTVARDGVEALTAFSEDAADVVVTDLMMPRLDGNGLIRQLRAANPDLPIVAVTGDVTRLSPEHKAGADPSRFALLAKSIRPTQLLESIQFLLTNQRELEPTS